MELPFTRRLRHSPETIGSHQTKNSAPGLTNLLSSCWGGFPRDPQNNTCYCYYSWLHTITCWLDPTSKNKTTTHFGHRTSASFLLVDYLIVPEGAM